MRAYISHVFVSYSRRQEAEVTRLVQELRRRGLEVWQDVSGGRSGIPYSTKWFSQIEDAIHTASGALIIDSPTWRESSACSDEQNMIASCRLPVCTIEASRLLTEFGQVVQEVMDWFRTDVDTDDNEYRTVLLTRSFRYDKRGGGRDLVPKTKGPRETLTALRELGEVKEDLVEFDDDVVQSCLRYCSYARRVLLVRVICAALIALVGAAAIPVAKGAFDVYQGITDSSDKNAQAAAYASFLRAETKTDPAYALYLLDDEAALGVFDPEEHFIIMQQAMMGLYATNYPSGYWKAGSAEATQASSYVQSQVADDSLVTVRTDGRVLVHNATTGADESFLVDGKPDAWCTSASGGEVVVAADHLAYVYVIGSLVEPAVLRGNMERIESVGMDGRTIYALTERGNVVTWENPFLPSVTQRPGSAVTNAVVAEGAHGPVAAFIDGQQLVLSADGTEHMVDLAPYGAIQQYFSFSPEADRLAVLVRDDAGANAVCVVEVPSGRVLNSYALDVPVYGLCFAKDGASVVLARSDYGGIACVSLADGTVTYSEESGLIGYNVVPYRDGYVLSDVYGEYVLYNAQMKLASDVLLLMSVNVPARQVAVCDNQGFAFTAHRGGNHMMGCTRVRLADGTYSMITVPTNDGMVSNTSVATSADGSLVALGYPDGSINVWDAQHLDMVYWQRQLAEQVSAVAFSGDGRTLYALGGTGSVYTFDLGSALDFYDSNDYPGTWQRYVEQGEKLRGKLEEMGLGISL
ncbi:MAG: toll/interleukin-1 receptor domain-containing protein [Coriobacteriales bacterium]|nr:toll/interleukin-1 receptor domain-containing protein [Coriobacteriales bacterium]